MPIKETIDGTHGEFIVSGKFTFADSSDFRKKLLSVFSRNISSLTIRLNDLQFMDSSGLGMLMVALKECQTNDVTLTLHQPKGDVRSLLEMTKCYERFTIVD